jgi:hypothetical protein
MELRERSQQEARRMQYILESDVPSSQVSRMAAPVAQEIDRLFAAGAVFPPTAAATAASAGASGAAERRETLLLALYAAAELAVPSAGYACEALGAAALVREREGGPHTLLIFEIRMEGNMLERQILPI